MPSTKDVGSSLGISLSKKKKKKAGEVGYQSPLFSFDPTKLRFLCNRYDLLYICNVHLFVILNFLYVYVLDV